MFYPDKHVLLSALYKIKFCITDAEIRDFSLIVQYIIQHIWIKS